MIFIDENGSGKSSKLEAIALVLSASLIQHVNPQRKGAFRGAFK
ncbi:MAG: hypothetical protein ABFC34_06675 [Methanobacterium sp.]